MFLYHFDRSGNLRPNMPINLIKLDDLPEDLRASKFLSTLEGGISVHGLNHLNLRCASYPFARDITGKILFDETSVSKQISVVNMRILEFNLELVRRAYFQEYPSRFQSLFAVRYIEEFTAWPELHSAEGQRCNRIFQIDVPDEVHRFDSKWLRGGLSFGTADLNYHIGYAPSLCFDLAFKYWSKTPSDNPRWEYLLPLPIDGARVHLAATVP